MGAAWAAVGLGVLAVAAFAPFGLWPLAPLSLAGLFLLWREARARRAAWTGFLYGLGFMGAGVSWVLVSIAQFGGVGPVLAAIATLGFVALLALFPALSGALAAVVPPRLRMPLGAPAAWTLGEALRGGVLTGFPWLSLGYSQSDGPLAGLAPVLGVAGIGWLLAVVGGLLAHAWARRRVWPLVPAGALLAAGLPLQRLEWTRPAGPPLEVALVQPSIPQVLKWKPEQLAPTLAKYRERTLANLDADLVIWPETAVPRFRYRVQRRFLGPLAARARARGSALVIGIPILDPEHLRYYNAALVPTPEGPGEVYAKRHLVPFGEYLPLEPWLGGLFAFLHVPMGEFAAGDSREPPLLHAAGRVLGVSICYEDAFSREVLQALPRAEVLVNLSNDAWFGDSLAPPQHLQIARLRALETGRPLLRATNSGISALIGHHGRILASAGLFEDRVVRGRVQPRQGLTPYAVTGPWPAWGLALGLWAGAAWRRKGRG